MAKRAALPKPVCLCDHVCKPRVPSIGQEREGGGVSDTLWRRKCFYGNLPDCSESSDIRQWLRPKLRTTELNSRLYMVFSVVVLFFSAYIFVGYSSAGFGHA